MRLLRFTASERQYIDRQQFEQFVWSVMSTAISTNVISEHMILIYNRNYFKLNLTRITIVQVFNDSLRRE